MSVDKRMIYFGLDVDANDPKVRIYGTPSGLRYLADLINAVADDDQEDLVGEQKSAFVQLRVWQDNPLVKASLSATIGRMDKKKSGSTDGFLSAVAGERGPNQLLKRTCQRIEKEQRETI